MPDYQLTLVVLIRTQLSIPLYKAIFYHTHVTQTKNIMLKIGNKLSIPAQILHEDLNEKFGESRSIEIQILFTVSFIYLNYNVLQRGYEAISG